MSNESPALKIGDKVTFGNSDVEWDVQGVYPIGPDGKRKDDDPIKWVWLEREYNRHGAWRTQVRKQHDITNLRVVR